MVTRCDRDSSQTGSINHLEAVGQNLAAFLVLGVGLLATLGLISGCQHRTPSRETGVEALNNKLPSVNKTLSVQPSSLPSVPHSTPSTSASSVRVIAPEGFNRRYADWLAGFQPLEHLLTQFNQLPQQSEPVTLTIASCSENRGTVAHSNRALTLCLEWIAELDDAFDDLAASPREQQLAVLDATFFWVVRQLSHRLLQEQAFSPEQSREQSPQQELEDREQLDQLTVILPQLLQQRSPGVTLSGTQWVFNQGYPQGVEQRMAELSGLALSLDNYERLICYAYGSAPRLYPYLASEFPQPERLERCESAAQVAMNQWRQRLAL